jgi:hypothetical protein
MSEGLYLSQEQWARLKHWLNKPVAAVERGGVSQDGGGKTYAWVRVSETDTTYPGSFSLAFDSGFPTGDYVEGYLSNYNPVSQVWEDSDVLALLGTPNGEPLVLNTRYFASLEGYDPTMDVPVFMLDVGEFRQPFFGTLTTESGGNWNLQPLKLSGGSYVSDGPTMTGYPAVPLTIDGTNLCNPVAGLNVICIPSDFTGDLTFLPIGFAALNECGLISVDSTTAQKLGNGSKETVGGDVGGVPSGHWSPKGYIGGTSSTDGWAQTGGVLDLGIYSAALDTPSATDITSLSMIPLGATEYQSEISKSYFQLRFENESGQYNARHLCFQMSLYPYAQYTIPFSCGYYYHTVGMTTESRTFVRASAVYGGISGFVPAFEVDTGAGIARGWTGTFTTGDARTATVTGGIITNVA